MSHYKGRNFLSLKIVFAFFLILLLSFGGAKKVFAWCQCINGWDCPSYLPQRDCAWGGQSGTETCECCSGCGGGGACFLPDTKIATPSGQTEIQNVKEGDIVKSFNPETGEIKEATVSDVHKRQVSGYYILKTESGREIKVTGEHPILARKNTEQTT